MIAPSLIIASTLFEGVRPEDVTAENVFSLRSTPLVGYEAKPAFRMMRNDGAAQAVRTIAELRAAEEEGYFAGTNADMRVWSYFKRVEDLLSAIYIARPSRVSFLKPISAIELLPARLVPLELNVENSDEQKDSLALNGTIGDLSKAGLCTVETNDAGRLVVRAAVETTLTEVMRGDFNGDGIEDLLVWQFHRMSGGSMHWSSSLALSRTSEHSLFSKVDLPFR